jgi:hypothetical protein
MSGSKFSIRMSPEVSKELLPTLEQALPENDRTIKRRVMNFDSADMASQLLSVAVEIINSKYACLAIASVIVTWMKLGKRRVIVKAGKTQIDISNVSKDELAIILSKLDKEELIIEGEDNDKAR